jgi:hypothetical protein
LFRLWLLDLNTKLFLLSQILLVSYSFFENFGLGLHYGRSFFKMTYSSIICWILLLLYFRRFTLKHLHVYHNREACSVNRHFYFLPPCNPLGSFESLLLFLDSESLSSFKSYLFDSHVTLVQLINLRIRQLRPVADHYFSVLLFAESIENGLWQGVIKINVALLLHLLVLFVI